jgi:two-component system nitrate/nitrite response regulator NarL
MEKIKVYLLDDHKIVRDGLKSLLALHPDISIVGEEGHPRPFLDQLPELDADILILDLSLPEMSGMEVLKKTKKARPELNVVILSMHDSPEYMIKAIKEGASTFLTKDVQSDILVEAIRKIKQDGVYFPTQLQMSSTSEVLQDLRTPEGSSSLLTPKEKEVLKLMVKGLSSKQMAAEFGLSARTVEAHRLNIMKKLGSSNSAETIAIALKLNLI